MELNIKGFHYDDNNDLIVITEDDRVLKFTNPRIESVNLGGRPLTEEEKINGVKFTLSHFRKENE